MATTIQTEAVLTALRRLQHANNQQLHEAVSQQLPGLSATTVHRITTRMVEQGRIRHAPADGKVLNFDSNPTPHDHFVCKGCGTVKDIVVSESIFDDIQQQLGKNIVENELIIFGVCVSCPSRKNNLKE